MLLVFLGSRIGIKKWNYLFVLSHDSILAYALPGKEKVHLKNNLYYIHLDALIIPASKQVVSYMSASFL